MTNDATSISNNTSNGCKLERKTIGSLRGRFFVPSYQRGYRWGKEDVRRLLDDVWESRGRPYSLQPVVVKPHSSSHSDVSEWELIDGQQRLTTLYLVLQYMRRETQCGLGAPYSLCYETRDKSEQYLQSLDPQDQNSNIDFYHLYHADRAIQKWFQQWGDKFAQNATANDMLSYLFKSVGIIWYEAAPTTSATELFTRLNVGRIPLTDAELVKAALLTAIPTTDHRAQEVAAQWDGIERDLHQPEVWAFVTGLSEKKTSEQYPTRISLLLDTLADNLKDTTTFIGKRPRYYTFDQLREQIEKNPTTFWEQVVALHAQILGWLAQPSIYNKIGYLVTTGKPFREIAIEANGMKKSAFDAHLTQLIRDKLKISKNDVEELSYKNEAKLLLMLLLMNVETVSKTRQRFPFARHNAETWSLEHIHAQNSEGLNKAEQWRSWLENHRDALQTVKSDKDETNIATMTLEIGIAIAKINNNIGSSGSNTFSGQDFVDLSQRVVKLLSDDDTDHHSIDSIRNMALLSSGQNSGLSNAVFEVKRRKVLVWDYEGKYVPVCTRNIFLKYYSGADALQPHFWSTKDKDAYIAAIHTILTPYYLNNTTRVQA